MVAPNDLQNEIHSNTKLECFVRVTEEKVNVNIFKVHSQPGNQGIVREFENGPFFNEKSVNYQGILIECQGNQGKIS